VFGRGVVADDSKEQIQELREKMGELTTERGFLGDALRKIPGPSGKR
jgi:hypothetical protein